MGVRSLGLVDLGLVIVDSSLVLEGRQFLRGLVVVLGLICSRSP